MARLSLFSCLFLAVMLATACGDVDPSNPYDPGAPESVQARGALAGRVVDSQGDALEGASVTLQGTALTGATDAQGEFALTEVPAGSHSLVISLEGHRTAAIPVLDLAFGEERSLPLTVLERARGAIRGRLRVAGGGVLELGGVRARVSDGPASLDLVAPAGGGPPGGPAGGDDLDFVVADVYAGTQTLTFLVPGHATPPVEGLVVPADGVLDLPDPVVATPVPVPLRVEVRAPAADEPLPPELEVVLAQNGVSRAFTVGDDGLFHPVAPHAGLVTLTVAHPRFQRVERTLVAAAPAEDTEVTLDPIALAYAYGRITGQVQTADCAPQAVPVAVAVDSGPTGGATLVTVPGQDTQGCSPGAAGGMATFEIAGLRAGAYRLRFASTDYVAATSETDIEVVQDASAAHPTVTLDVAYGRIRGTVRTPLDGTAGFDRAGTLVALDAAPGGLPGVPTDADGAFELPTLRPGIHGLSAQRPGGGFQDLHLSAVVVQPGATADIGVLDLAFATGRIRGHVALDTGESAEGAEVQFNGPESGVVRLDATGDFLFADKRAGTYRVTATARGFAPRAVEVEVRRHLDDVQTDDLVLSLLPGRVVGSVEYQRVDGEAEVPQISVEGHPAVALVPDGLPELALPANAFALGGLREGTYTVSVAFPPRYRTKSLPGVLLEAGRDTRLPGIQLERASGSVVATFALADAATLSDDERTRLLSTLQVRLSSETGGLAYTSLADGEGRVEFPSVLVDRYTLTAALPDYLPSVTSGVLVSADLERRVLAETLALPVNPGRVRGHVGFADQGADSTGITVEVVGTAVDAVTGPDGTFDLADLKAGVYALRFTGDEGYRPVTISPVIVVAGENTDLADVLLPPAYGGLSGQVVLEDRDDASGAVVQVLSGEAGALVAVANALVNADGSFAVPDVRVGQYTVVAHHPDFVDETENAVAVAVDRTTPLAFRLALDRGRLAGTITLSDGAPVAAGGVLVSLEQTGETVNVDAGGRFQFDALPPGVYSVLALAEGYAPTNSQPIAVGPGADAAFGQPLVLVDLKAPDAPTLTACDALEPLPGFPESPVFVRTEPVDLGGRPFYPVVVALDAGTDPFADANFDPAAGRGRWEWRGSTGPWQTVPALALDADPRAECPHNFTFPLKGENSVETLEIRAVDADGNIGNSGLLLVVADARAPLWFRASVEGARCADDTAQADVPAAQILPPPLPALPAGVAGIDPLTVCDVADTSATLRIAPAAGDPGFGCYYVHSEAWRANDAAPLTVAQVQDRLFDAAGELDLDAFDTEICLPAGTQAITVTPGGEETLYCVAAVDQSRRLAPMTFPCFRDADCGAGICDASRQICVEVANGVETPRTPTNLTNCVVVRPDTTAPLTMDLFPDGAEVRGGRAVVYSTDAPSSLDANFDHFEVQGPTDDPTWRTLPGLSVGVLTAFEVSLVPGTSNTLQFRAVDRAGNAGTPVVLTLEDTTVLPVDEGEAAVGKAPSLLGERVAWAQPRGCDPTGESKLCTHGLQISDDAGLVPSVATAATLSTCAFGCPQTNGGREPMLALMPNGVAYTDFAESGNGSPVNRLMYLHFGADGRPGTADDGRRPACSANPECSELVTGSTCVANRCSLPAGYVAELATGLGAALAGPAANGAVMRLATNEGQIATAEQAAAGWTLRRFQVERVTGWAHTEQSLSTVSGQPIAQTVTSLAAIGNGTAFTLADGSLYVWDSANTVTAIPFPATPNGTSLRALRVLGTSRYVAVVLQLYSGAAPDPAVPTFALSLDLGPDLGFTRNNGNIVETFRGPGVGCNASHTCAAEEMACITLAAGETCLPQVGFERPDCVPGRQPNTCGQRIVEAGMDNDLMAWTTESIDDDGLPRARVVTWRVSQTGLTPRVVVERAGGKSAPSVHLDRVAYLDEDAGAPRVNIAEPAALGWMLLDRRPKKAPVLGRGWVAYASYEAGLPATVTAPASPAAVENGSLRIVVTAEGATLTTTVAGAGRRPSELAAAINESPGIRNHGHPILSASMNAQGRLVLTTTAVGATTSLAVNAVAPAVSAFGFAAAPALQSTGSDANTADSGLFVAPVTKLGQAVAVPTGDQVSTAPAQVAWSQGRHYDLAGDLLVTVETGRNGAGAEVRHDVVAYDLPFQDPGQGAQNISCDTADCLRARKRTLQSSAVAGDTVEDVATDGRRTVWAITGGADAGLYYHDAAAGVRLVDAAVKCRHVAVSSTQTGPNTVVTQVACVGYSANRNDPNDQFVRIWARTNDAGAFTTTTLAIPAATGGLIVGLWLNDTDLVIERQEDGVLRVLARAAGRDGIFGAAANSDDVPSANGQAAVMPFDPILGRSGDDAGAAGLYRGQFVYSDANGIGQSEIYRFRLRGRQRDRLTHDGNTQHFAAAGDAGLVFVDHRYTVTAQGRPVTPPGLTLRTQP